MAVAAPRQAAGEITALLGRGATFDGTLTFEGAVRIDGKFKGEVFSDGVLIVGDGAHVEAAIAVGEIIIRGTVIGDITAKRSIEITESARVTGDVKTAALQIAKGAMFNGRSVMETKLAPAPARATEAPVPQPGPTSSAPAKT
jgi:cytoskeletal protein CcmA (bactofilin family)